MGSWPLLGEGASLLAAMIWAVSMSLYTRFGHGVSSRHLNLFKNCLALGCLLIASVFVGWSWPGEGRTYAVLALSGVVGLAVGDTLLFIALKDIGVQNTSVIQCLAPPFAALMAWAFFGERLIALEWAGLALTVVFLALLLRARSQTIQRRFTTLGLSCALGAALCQAFAMTSLRWSLQGVDVWVGTFLRVLPSIAGLVGIALYHGDLHELSGIFRPRKRGYVLSFAAFMGTFLGLVLMSTGAKYAKAGVATALGSTTPIWILPVAHFMLGEKITPKLALLTFGAVLGVALMILAPYLGKAFL